jgi:hypothetical protein
MFCAAGSWDGECPNGVQGYPREERRSKLCWQCKRDADAKAAREQAEEERSHAEWKAGWDAKPLVEKWRSCAWALIGWFVIVPLFLCCVSCIGWNVMVNVYGPPKEWKAPNRLHSTPAWSTR